MEEEKWLPIPGYEGLYEVPGKYSTLKLAKEYNVNKTTIIRIIRRKMWTHI